MPVDFELDNQTKKDLDLFSSPQHRCSLFGLFNKTITQGGKDILLNIMSHPSTDMLYLKDRIETISFFQKTLHTIPLLQLLDKNNLDFIEYYLDWGSHLPTQRELRIVSLGKMIRNSISPTNEQYIIETGICNLVNLLHTFRGITSQLITEGCNSYLKGRVEKLNEIIYDKELDLLLKDKKKINSFKQAEFDYYFRYKRKMQIRYLLDQIYYWDALISVAKVSDEYGFAYPELCPSKERIIELDDFYHPYLTDPVKNSMRLTDNRNVLFVTGSNMAGKSTFLKALGLSVYLSHVGFPVPASRMKISILQGMYTTINFTDRIDLGYSHFFAEVQRVKTIAERLQEKPDMLVIFDELFRGTNVKDAYDGTADVISAFAQTKSSFHVISTHIVEVAEVLKESNIRFVYMETLYESHIPTYTYKIKEGISTERVGAFILQQEKVVEAIQRIRAESPPLDPKTPFSSS